MRPDEIYHEKVGFFWGWLGVGLSFVLTATMVILFISQQTHGPIGDNPAPDWVYAVMGAFSLVIGIIMINFSHLTVRVNPQGITAGYGPFRHFEPWDNIADAKRDESLALRSYGGWGIRFVYRNGGWVQVYNIIGTPTLLLKLKEGKKKYFGFSTKRPDEMAVLINNWKR